jgi:hypothetical protein
MYRFWGYQVLLSRGKNGICSRTNKSKQLAGLWWLMPVILATWEAEMGRIAIRGQPGKTVLETPCPK